MSKRARRFSGVMAVLAFAAWSVGAGTALAGTTGSLRGVVTEIGGAPIAGVTVTVTSPSQTASTVTDSGGHFTFASLAPDDYAVSAEKDGYDKASYAGAVVFADVTQVLTVTMRKQLEDDRDHDLAILVVAGAPRHDLRRLFDQRRAASAHQRPGRRRHAQQRVFGDFRRPGRLRSDQPVRLQPGHSHPRRRFERSRLRVGRHSR